MSIRLKLFVSFSLLFVLMLLSVELVKIYGIPNTNIKGEYFLNQSRVLKNLSFIADLKKERIVRWFKERIDDSKVFSQNIFLKSNVVELISIIEENAAKGLKEEKFRTSLKNIQAYQDLIQYMELIKVTYGIYEQIEVLDFKSLTRIASTSDSNIGKSLLLDSEALLSDLAYQGVVVRTRSNLDSDKVSLFIYQSIFNENKEIAVLSMSVNTDDIFGPMNHIIGGLGSTGEVFLVNQDVKILTSLRYPLLDGSRPRLLEYQIEAMPAYLSARGEEGIVIAEDYRGITVLAAYRHLNITPEVGWGLVVKKDRVEVFNPFRKNLIQSIFIFILFTIPLIIAVWLISKKITSPLLALSLVAKKVEEGNLDVRASVNTLDEVGALAEIFNSMVAKVAERTIDLEAANLELKSLSRLKSMFIASMSHELRTPLNSIIGFTGILIQGLAGELNEEQTRQLTLVKSSSRHLLSLINDIIDVSKIETDKVELFIEEFDLAGQLSEIKDIVALTVKEKGLVFSIDAPDKLLVTSDEMRVKQIIINLVSNAIKFSESGDVRIQVAQKVDTVEVSVYDIGVGIKEEDIKKLFLAFSRIPHEDKIIEGSGLGLYLSQKLAELLGGEIRVESEFGKGSVFTLSLPLRYKEELS